MSALANDDLGLSFVQGIDIGVSRAEKEYQKLLGNTKSQRKLNVTWNLKGNIKGNLKGCHLKFMDIK